MQDKFKTVNWEKLSVYFSSLAVVLMIWSSLNQLQHDDSDIKERVAKLEVKVEHLEK